MASLLPQLYFDSGSGLTPSDGALLFFNVVGSEVDKDTYTTAAATTAHANPVVADSKGVFPQIFISGDYDWVLQNKNLVQQDTGSVSEVLLASESAFPKNFATLALAVADAGLVNGDELDLAEYFSGTGGGGRWYVELLSAGAANTIYRVAWGSNTGAATDLVLVLRVGDSAQCKQFGLLDGATATANTAVIHAAMDYQLSIGGGKVVLGVGDFAHNTITWPGAGIILVGSNGIAYPENYSTAALGSTLSYSGGAGNGLRCHYNGCGVRDLLLIDTVAANATIGINTTPGATPGTPLFQTSSYFEISNVVVRGFLQQVDSDAMSGNDGGWFHRYTNFVFAGRGKSTVGSIGVGITSNTASMHFGQVRGSEIGIDQGADKCVFDCELSGCGTGWITNGGAFSHHIFTTEANDRDLNFNDSSENRDNNVHLLFSNSGTLDSASVPTSNQNTMQFGNVFYGIKNRAATATQTGTVLLTWSGATPNLIRNETAGMIVSVANTAVGEYEFTLRKSVSYISVQCQMMENNSLRVVVADSTNLRSGGASDKIKIRTYGFDNQTLTELPNTSVAGVLVQISNYEVDIIDI